MIGFLSDYVRRVVERYRGRFHVWQCAARVNTGIFLGMSAQQKIRMVLRMVELVRELDGRTPIVMTLDQPWGEYVARQETDLPLHLADTLLRSGLEVSGLGLEVNVGYYPGGTGRRDALEFSRQLDRWSLLGLPLVVTLVVPSGHGPDPQARLPTQPADPGWNPQRQDAWVREHLPVLLSKSSVQAIMWNQLSDAEPHEFAHGGLLDAEARPKAVVSSLANLRQQHLV